MSLYWEDQLYERTEIREDTKELRAQGGLCRHAAGFYWDTGDKTTLFTNWEPQSLTVSLSLRVSSPLYHYCLLSTRTPRPAPAALCSSSLILFASVKLSCNFPELPNLHKEFWKLVFKKNSKWWPVSLGRNEPRAKNMFYKWTNGRAIWSYQALLDCGPGSGISCKWRNWKTLWRDQKPPYLINCK